MVSHKVEVTIDNQVAVTKIAQVFKNETGSKVEARYFFPVPDEASINRFVTWINGEMREGKIKEKQAAKAEYEAAKAAGKKAVLLEGAGKGEFSVAISEIAAGAEQRIELEYMEVIGFESGTCEYGYPLTAGGASGISQDEFSFAMTVRSEVPITSVVSNSHAIEKEVGPSKAVIGFKASGFKPDKDLHVAYTLRMEDTGIDVIAFRKGGDGYFMVMITPKSGVSAAEALAKDLVFVIDTSGSMAGQKMDLAKRALHYCIRTLNRKDRFNIVHFNYSAAPFRGELMHPTFDNMEAAKAFIDSLQSGGGTNIDHALTTALGMNAGGDRPFFVVFVTDGMPTQGETNQDRIIENARGRLKDNARIFNFGIGADLNYFLLRQLAKRSRGTAEFVPQEYEMETRISTFQAKISMPVLSDLKLDMGESGASAVYPNDIAYLFAGEQLLVLGKYGKPGRSTVVLSAKKGQDLFKFEKTFDFPETDEARPSLPKLWAMKKIRMLLDEIALKGENEELKTEVLDLGLKYGIATPYTSFLVSEDLDATVSAEKEKLKRVLQDKSAPGAASRAGRKDSGSPSSGGAAPPTGGAPAPNSTPTPTPTPSPTPSPGLSPGQSPTPTPTPTPGFTGGKAGADAKKEAGEESEGKGINVMTKVKRPGADEVAARLAAWILKDGKAPSAASADAVSLAAIVLIESGSSREWGPQAGAVAAALDGIAGAAQGISDPRLLVVVACALASSCAETGTSADTKVLKEVLDKISAGASALTGDETAGWCGFLSWKLRKAGIAAPGALSAAVEAGLKAAEPGPGACAAAVFTGAGKPKASSENLAAWALADGKAKGDAFLFFSSASAFGAGEEAYGAFCAKRDPVVLEGLEMTGEGRGMWKAESAEASVRATSLRQLALMTGYMLKQGTVK